MTSRAGGNVTRPPRLTDQGRRTRGRIVEAAAELFFTKGVAGTSVEDVLTAASVSASQVYHYFGDKNGLVRAVIEYRAQSAPDPDAEPDGLDSLDKLDAWCAAAVTAQIAREFVGGCELGSLASELAETGADVRCRLAVAFARWESPLLLGLQAMRRRGELSADADPESLAAALLAALQGGILLAQTRRTSQPLRAALDAVMQHVRSFASDTAT